MDPAVSSPIFCAGKRRSFLDKSIETDQRKGITAYHGVLKANLKKGETLAVIGCGGREWQYNSQSFD